MADDHSYATAVRDKVYVYRMDYAKDKWQSINLEGEKDKVQFIKKGDGEHYFRVVVNGKREDHLIAKDANIDCTESFVQVPLAGSKELYGVKFKLNDDAMTFFARIRNHISQNPQPFQTSRETTQSTSGEILPAPFYHTMQSRQPKVPSVRPKAPPPQEPIAVKQQTPFSNHRDMQSQPGPKQVPMSMQPPQHQQMPQASNQVPMSMQVPHQQMPQASKQVPMSMQPLNQQQIPANKPPPPPVHQPLMNNLSHPGAAVQQQPAANHHMMMGQVQDQQFRMNQNAPAAQMPNQMSPPYQQHQQQPSYQQQPQPGGAFARPQDHGALHHPPSPQAQTPSGQPAMPAAARQQSAPRKPVEVQPKDLPIMATMLMNAINTGDKGNAAELVDSIMSVKVRRQFSISCDANKECPEEPQFALNVRIEFQQSKKQPLDIYLDVVESHTILYFQHIMEHKYFIPKASQNWIIGPRLIKEDEMGKSLKDFDITHKAGTPTVFMYVVHAKKANVPRDDYEVIRERRAQAANQQPVPMQSVPQENTFMQQQQQQQQQPPSQYSQANQQNQYSQGNQQQQPNQYPQGNQQQYRQPSPQAAWSATNTTMPYQHQDSSAQNYSQGAPLAPQENLYGHLGDRGFQPGYQNQHPLQPPHRQQPPVQYNMPGEPLYGRLGGEGDAFRGGTNVWPPSSGGAAVGGGSNAAGDGAFQVRGGLAVFASSPNTPQSDGVPIQQAAAATPIPAPRPPKPKPGWDCPECTFKNKPHRPGCEICSAPRPADYEVPEDVPLDKETERIRKQEEESEKLFLQYEEKEQQLRRQEAEENYKQLMEADEAKIVANPEEFECMICADDVAPGNGVILKGCLHQFCKQCMHDHVMLSDDADIKCPYQDANYACGAVISEREIREVVDDDELQKVYQRGLQLAENADADSFHCRHTDCKGFCFVADEVNEFVCPICKKPNCLLCKAIHEDMDCQEYQDDLKRRAENDAAAQATQNMLEDLVRNGEAMKCPKCDIVVQKKDGCDWIRCSMCRTEICWATKGPRWGPNGHGDTSGGCKCRVGGKKCHALCRNCH